MRDEELRRPPPARAVRAGADDDGVLLKPPPLVGTFHAAGGSARTAGLNRRAVDGQPARPALRRVRRRPSLARGTSAAPTCELFNGIEVDPFAKASRGRPSGRRSCSSAATSPGRASPSCSTRMTCCRRTSGCGSAATAPTRRAASRTPATRGIEWLGRISDEEKGRRLRGADVFCAPSLRGESFGVVLLEAMAAGRRSSPATCPATAGGPAGPDALSCRPGTSTRWPAPCERVLDAIATAPASSCVRSGEAAGRASSRMDQPGRRAYAGAATATRVRDRGDRRLRIAGHRLSTPDPILLLIVVLIVIVA